MLNRLLLATALAAVPLTFTPGMANATLLDDPLHGFCFVGANACTDAGSITSIFTGTGFQGAHFGFDISPPNQTGLFWVVVATPNNEAGPANITGTINGASVGTVSLTARGSWTSGFLDAQPGIAAFAPSASPSNPFDNFIGFTKTSDPGAVSYNLSSAFFSTRSLVGPGDAALSAMDLTTAAPIGSMIFGFFENSTGDFIATASSGVLWVDANSVTPPPIPEPASIALLGVGLLGLGLVRRRAD